jgi:hypothetical protein
MSSKIEKVLVASDKWEKVLRSMRFDMVVPPILFLLVYYLISIVTNSFEWEDEIFLVKGALIGIIIGLVWRLWYPIWVYQFSIDSEALKLHLVNFYGRQKTRSFSLVDVEKIKYSKKKKFAKIWIHLKAPDSIFEYTFIDNELGGVLYDKLNVEKFKTNVPVRLPFGLPKVND